MQRYRTWLLHHPWAFPIITTILAYWPVLLTYFEQDEWRVFGEQIIRSDQPPSYCFAIQRPLACFANWATWRTFGAEASFYGLLSLLFILAIILLFYALLRRWRLDPWRSAIAAALLPLFATGSHAITWFGAIVSGLPSYFFALLSLYLLTLDLEKPSWLKQLGVIVAAIVSLYFKEESLWLLVMLPVTWWFFSATLNQSLTIRSAFRHVTLPSVGILILILLERYRQLHSASFGQLVSTTDQSQYLKDVVTAIVSLPWLHLDKVVINNQYLPIIAETLNLPMKAIAIIFSIVIIVAVTLLAVRDREKQYRSLLLWGLAWIFTSFLAYSVFGKVPEFLELRYYFPAQAPMALLLVLILTMKFSWQRKVTLLGPLLLLVIVLLNIVPLQERINGSVKAGQERKRILQTVQREIGSLPNPAIIYIEVVGEGGFNGAPMPILPFLSGPGYAFQVLFSNDQDFRPLLSQNFLWGWLDEGYRQENGVGFGYFRDYNSLNQALDTAGLSPQVVHAFRYEKQQLTTITNYIRERLALARTSLNPVPRDGWSVTTSEPEGAAPGLGQQHIIDADSRSLWASYHVAGKYVEIDLGRSIENIAGLSLTSGGPGDYLRRYTLSYSSDGQDWKVAVHDIGRPEGLVQRILFSPITVRKFRITQEETIATSYNWTIADLQVYKIQP